MTPTPTTATPTTAVRQADARPGTTKALERRRRTGLAGMARAAAGALAGCCLVAGTQAADLEVRITPASSSAGQVMVALFAEPATFLKTPLMALQAPAELRAADGSVRLVFSGLPPGRYALSAYQDLNGNRTLDANVMGLPTEPYGFSNGAKANFGPPKFEAAAVVLEAAGGQAAIALE